MSGVEFGIIVEVADLSQLAFFGTNSVICGVMGGWVSEDAVRVEALGFFPGRVHEWV